jgi:hypothetical protein
VNDEASEHSHHFLHRHMRVVEEGSVLMELKFVYESLARHDRFLADACDAVHLDRQFEAMPMNTCRLR